MERSFEERWSDFRGHYCNFRCPFCNQPRLDFDNPKFDSIAGIDVVAVSCYNCGHVELFNVAEVKREGDRLDKEHRDKGLR